ncbi:GAF domain-containing protein [Agromyces sp. NPDC058484]|uniref:GAF domain-containing protein n=1 Tax=Agromyces sp. NPDC058484 TaxID=3346524 RepID=UPI003650F23B
MNRDRFGWVDRRRAARITVNVGVVALGGVIVAGLFGLQGVQPLLTGLWWILATVVGLCLVGFQVWRAYRDAQDLDATDHEINNLRIAVKDSLLPIALLLAEMPALESVARLSAIKTLCDQATVRLAVLLLHHIPHARANVFVLDPSNTKLIPLSTSAGDYPDSLDGELQPAARAVLKWVLEGGKPRVVNSARSLPPEDGGVETDAPYGAYVAVVIRSQPFVYGMLTVDAPPTKPVTFTDTDVQTIKLVAGLLAIGFATAYIDPPGEAVDLPTSRRIIAL